MNYVNVFNKRCAMIFNQILGKKKRYTQRHLFILLCIDGNSSCRYILLHMIILDELVNEIKSMVRI